MNGVLSRLSLYLMTLLAALLFSGEATAGGVRVIQNPSFELHSDASTVTFPPPGGLIGGGTTWAYWLDSSCSGGTSIQCIGGWKTTDSNSGASAVARYIEVALASTYGAFGAQNNRIVAELNASMQSRLYQPICLQAGETVTMNYYFSPRNGVGNQQVAAGLWSINDTGPIGGAISSQNSTISSTVGFTPQTAVFTAPGAGLYQIGLEAVQPATGSNGNLIDDISVILKPLIDLNTQATFDMPEGDVGPSLQIRVNGTILTPTVVAIRQTAGVALPDVDYVLGSPIGLSGTTPTLSHTSGSNLWLLTIPPGEYDAGQGMFGNAKYGVVIPIQSTYDVLRESTEPLKFELQPPSADGSDPVVKWDRTNPICEGASTNEVSYNIVEVRPKLRVHKNLIARVNAADQFTTIIKDDLGNVVSSTSASLTSGGGVSTTGAGTGLFSAPGVFEGSFGSPYKTYTITEVMASGSVNTLSAYTTSISCTNARVVGAGVPTVLPSGVGQTFTVTIKDSDDISCTLTNAPLPKITTFAKALGSTRAAPTDQFTLQVLNGVSVVNPTTTSTSGGSGNTITAGTGVISGLILQPYVAYTLKEVGAGSPAADLGLYNTIINCSNAYAASSTVLPSGAQTGPVKNYSITLGGNDDITCTLTNIAHQPRVTLSKALTSGGRLNAADQFTVQLKQGATVVASGTSAGAGSAVTAGTGTTGPNFLSAGVAYTLTEVMAAGSSSTLSAYNTRISCTNENAASTTVLPSGLGQSFSLTPQLDDVIACTLTNGNPRIRVNKVVSALLDGADRFTTQIRTGGAGGTVVSGTTASGSAGGGVLTTGGAATYAAPGYFLGTVGTVYTLTEAISGGTSTLSNYNASISCTNTTVGSSTVLPSGSTQPFTLTPQFNDDIDCTITNITQPRISLIKALGNSRANDSDEFQIRLQGGAINLTSTTAGTGSTITAGTGAIAATQVVAGTSYTLSEVMAAGSVNPLSTYNSRISCTNTNAGSVTTLPLGAGTSFTLTPQLGDVIACTLTNDRLPRLRINKVISGGLVDSNDRFTTQILSNAGANPVLSGTGSDPQTGGGVLTTGGTGTYNAPGMLVVTSGTTYILTEDITAGTSGLSQYTSSISCTNATSGSATTLPSGSGQRFTITPTTGDNISCTLTNAPKAPVLRLNKKVSGLINGADRFTTQIKNGATVVSSTTASPGGGVVTTGGAATYTVAGAYSGTAGTTYTLTEILSTGSTPLSQYSTAILCTNTRSDGPVTSLPAGVGQSFSLTLQSGDDITCQLDNGPAAITLIKDLANSRLVDTDEFTMEIRNSGGTVLNSLISSTTAGQQDVVTPGSGTTGATYLAGGSTYTLTETASGGTTLGNYHTSIACTNAVSSGTALPSQGFAANKTFTVTPASGDNITCTLSNKLIAPKITLKKVLGGQRYVSTDQFTLQVRDSTPATVATTTTTGTGDVVSNGSVVYAATAGATYTLRELASSGSLANYVTTYACINNATGATLSGTATSLSYTAAQYDDLVCTFTNAPKPRLIVNKVVATGLVDANDRFTTQIRTGGAAGTVVSGTTNSATAGGGVLTTGGAGTYTAPGAYLATGGTTYTITEAITAGTSSAAQYHTSISCANADTNSTTVLPSGTTQPFDIAIQNSDLITCTLTNTPQPRLKVNKTVVAVADATDRFTTQIRTGGVSGSVVSGTTASATIGGGLLTTAGAGTYTAPGKFQATAGTTYTFTEALTAGVSDIAQYASSLVCTNAYAGSTTALPTTAYPFTVTPQLGDDITCTYTNNTIAPKIRVHKAVAGLVDANDRFTTELRTGGVSGTVVSGATSSATVGGGVFTTGGAGTYNAPGDYLATAGTTYTVTEALSGGTSAASQYDTAISCVNARVAGPATLLPSGMTPPFQLTPKSGDDISCTLTNAVKPPVITLRKDVTVRVNAADQFTLGVNGGSVSQTATTTGAATGIQSVAINGLTLTAGTAYTLSETKAAGPTALNLYKTELSCSNARAAGPSTTLPASLTTITPAGAPLTSSYVITPLAGDILTCTFTNSKNLPKLRVHKTVSSLVDANDRFTTEIRTGGAAGTVVSGVTASATTGGGVLTTGGVATYSAAGIYQGTEGTAYTLTESISGGTSSSQQYTTTVSCSNAFGGSATVMPTNAAVPYTLTPQLGDDITCTLTNAVRQPVVRVHKTVTALVDANDRFTTQLRTGGVSGTVVSGTSASLTTGGGVLTTGGAATYNAPGSYQATVGTPLTITEALSGGSSLANQYATSLSCSNSRTSGPATTLPSGSTPPFDLTPKAGDDISCTLINTPIAPLIRVNKTVTSIVNVADRFTTQIRTGGAGGTVVSDTSASATSGGGVLTTAGAGSYNAPGSYQATAGTAYTLTEVMAAGPSNIGQYNTVINCTNSRSGAVTALPSGAAQPFSLTPAAGDNISCTVSNAIRQPTVVISKLSTGSTGSFSFSTTNLTTTPVAISTTIDGTPVSSAVNPVTTRGANITITESVPANWTLTAASCTDANSAATGNSGSFGTLAGNQLTIAGVNVVAGADLRCTFTNRKSAAFTLRKSWENAKVNDAATVSSSGAANNTSLSTVANTATEIDAAAAVTLFAGETITIAESFTTGNAANYAPSVSCTGATDTNLADGLTVNAADAAIVCTLTNSRLAKSVTLQKTWLNAKVNDAVSVTATGLTSLASTANTASETDAGSAQTVYAGDVITLAESFTTGSASNYTSSLVCTGTTGLSGNTLTVGATDTPITCTQTNSRIAKSVTLQKTWVNAKLNDAVNVTATGLTTLASTANTASETDAGSAQTVYAGDVITLGETFTTGSAANYTSSLACTGTTGLSGNTLTVGATDTPITCTQTNSRIAKSVTLRKSWVNAKVNDAVNVTATGLTTLASTANTASETDAGSAQTVYAGDVITLGETFTTGSAANYTSSLACTGTTGLSGNTLTVGATDTPITCTQTNSRIAKSLTLQKTWLNAKVNDAVNVTATGLTTLASTANTASETDAGSAQTVYAGDVITLGETFTTGSAANYTSSLACTGTTGLSGNTLTVGATDTPITCTYSNSRKSANLTLQKTWVNAKLNDAVNVTATGLTTLASTANTASETDAAPAQAVYAGDAITLGEAFTTGDAANYTTTLGCTGNATALAGSVLTVSAADSAITCTYSNSRKSATLVLQKTWVSAKVNDAVNLTATGLTTYASTANTANETDTAAAQTVYAGDVITLAEVFTAGTAGSYSQSLSCTGNVLPLAGSVLTVDAADTALTCTFTNNYTVFTLSGRVFLDNGTGGGTAHNGTQQAGELGRSGAIVRLTNCAGVEYQQVSTGGTGSYSLQIPNTLATGSTLCVTEDGSAAFVSVSGSAGTTGGSYNLVQDRTQFTLTALTSYTGVNFGDVPESLLSGVGAQATGPGTTVSYAHVFTAGTAGAVTFSPSQNPTPANPDWVSVLYRDTNCNAALDGGEPPLSGAVAVTAGQTVCLIQKVIVPVTTITGHVDESTVTASFAFAAPSAIVRPYTAADVTTVVDNGLGLFLVKEVRQVGGCPSSGSDTNVFGTANDAAPGSYLEYRIRYTNQSQGVVKDVVITDDTPAFTVYRSASCSSTPPSVTCVVPSSGSGTAPAAGGTGNIRWVFGNNPLGLTGGQGGEVRFCVQVEQ
ncbi:MAG TPA: hypothetical protein VFW49_06595 [Fluviicoccus sp.]|nr:hypothetical protein [Fluviicoccus sp.]